MRSHKICRWMPPKKFQYKEDENAVTTYQNNIITILWYSRTFVSSVNVYCGDLVHANLSTYRQRQPLNQCKNPTSDGDQHVDLSLSLLLNFYVLLLVLGYSKMLKWIIIWSILLDPHITVGGAGQSGHQWQSKKGKWENLKCKYKLKFQHQ